MTGSSSTVDDFDMLSEPVSALELRWHRTLLIANRSRRWVWLGLALFAIIAASIMVAVGVPLLPSFTRGSEKSTTQLSEVGGTYCCSRGSDGNQGSCALGDSDGQCCAGETALVCKRGTSCFLTKAGHPYCCPAAKIGCFDACVDVVSKHKVLATGGQCDGVAPPGLIVPGSVLYIDAKWDQENNRYDFLSHTVAVFNSPPFTLGTSDFSLSITVTPYIAGRLSSADVGRKHWTFLMGRGAIQPDNTFTGYHLAISDMQDSVFFGVSQVRDPKNSAAVIASFSQPLMVNAPRKITAIRQSGRLGVFVDGVLLGSALERIPIDVDKGSQLPFVIGGVSSASGMVPSELHCYLSDMAVSNSAQTTMV